MDKSRKKYRLNPKAVGEPLFKSSWSFDSPAADSSSTIGRIATGVPKKPRLTLQSSKLAMLDSPNYIDPIAVSKVSWRKLKRQRKEEKLKTKGSGWFNMGAPELTEERKNDLEALRLRGALDTKRFYKRNNITTRPKYFQVGRIVDNPADFYHSRVPKKQRKNTLAEEMVAEASRNLEKPSKTTRKRLKK